MSPHYFVLQISWTSEEALRQYSGRLGDMIERHGGRFTVAARDPPALEGSWKPGRLIVIEFPTEDAFHQWYDSEEYRPLRAFRLSNSKSDAVAVAGI